MKRMKKLSAIALVLVLAVALATSTFAATITVTPAVDGQTYSAYKIFDVTKTASGDGYAYTISTASPWYTDVAAYAADTANGLTLTAASGVSNVFNVSVRNLNPVDPENPNFSAANFAAYLNGKLSGKTANDTAMAAIPAGEEAAEAEITGLAPGYYFVDSSLGALCILNTAADEVEVNEKNEVPDVDKKVEGSNGWGSENTAAIGDIVNFKITVTIPKGTADTTYVVKDLMSAGLTFDINSIVVKVGETAVDSANYTKDTDATSTYTFKITFEQAYIASLAEDTKIDITYSAVLNANAVTGPAGNSNGAKLEYGNTSSVTVTTTTYTYEFDLVKTDKDDKVITGAKFELYDALTGGNKISLVEVSDGVYRPATAAEKAASGFESAVIEVGTATIKGLDAKTYYLEETAAPAGYNLLDARVSVTLTGNSKATVTVEGVYQSGGVQVVNETGVLLPTTGGMGTTLFYALGGILAVGALVVLVTRRRMRRNEN